MHRFLENAHLLHERLGIVLLMYGSLGLQYRTGEELHADDVDILIPGVFLKERWGELLSVLEPEGYVLVDEREHTFEKNSLHFSYASIEELTSFAGIEMGQIESYAEQGVPFKLLSLEQYLNVYRASIKDGYRIQERGKKDQEKIDLIEKHLQCSGPKQ